jgi:hypothetical protein
MVVFKCTLDTPQRTPKTPPVDVKQQRLQGELAYLKENSDIAWLELEGSSVFIGWKTIPEDFEVINRGAAFNAHKTIQDTAEVWSLRSWQQGWRPGSSGDPICRTIAYGGKVQASTCK